MSVLLAVVAVLAVFTAVVLSASAYRSLPATATRRDVVRRALWSVPAVLGVAVGLVVRACGVPVPFPAADWVATLLGAGVAVLGVVGGGPVAEVVLRLTGRTDPGGTGPAAEPEVLRGGTAIGVLERAAVVAAVAVGSWEIVAGVIAVKGLGRFSELAKGDAREQFIIGTLVSLLWAGVCAGLVWFGR